MACSTRSGCSLRPDAGADRLPRHQARRSGLRGHLERGGLRGAEASGRRAADRAERLALLDRQAGCSLRRRQTRVAETNLPLAYVNQVGGQDELVFDGASFVLNDDASLAVQLPAWEEAIGVTEWRRENGRWRCLPGFVAEVRRRRRELSRLRYGLARLRGEEQFPRRRARALGRHRNGTLRGDGRRCAGPRRVHGVMLPYTYTSNESLSDAAGTAEALHIRYDIMPIHSAVDGLTKSLGPVRRDRARRETEENLQSRPVARC